ncbi:hypothetical protein [Photobacterium damselae]|uniref:hypothetical protein n=1 Tax=Photobacterium damselae TaxID=38293 RepID=UPI001F3F4227|nr:hypothetical protein [Photobacterium damselae]UKA04495.1 hypothetical protein IHC89_23000 [Photobacterium damselae subsp. damselae]
MNSSIVRQKPVSYRVGSFSSKVTVQPVLFELLTEQFGNEEEAYSFIAEQAKLAKLSGIQSRLSAFVQNCLLSKLISPKFMHGYVVDSKKKDIRIESPFHDKGSKLTLDSALHHAITAIANEYGTTQKEICAQYTERYKDKFKEHLTDNSRGKDVSHEMREAMIRDLAKIK